MSSVVGAYSQVAPFKRWIVGSGGGFIYNKNGAVAVAVSVGVVLKDMGKYSTAATVNAVPPVGTAGSVLRKVAVLPTPATTGPVVTGYIYLSDAAPSAQNVALLN